MNLSKIDTMLKKRSAASHTSDDKSSIEADSPKPRQGPVGLYSVNKVEERWDRFGRHLVSTVSPVFVFISIWLLWFGITSPVPSRRLGPSLMAIDGQGAARNLARAVGASAEDFAAFPADTGCGIWFGAFGSCVREPNGPLVCQAPSANADYTPSVVFLNDTIPLADGLIAVINALPNSVKALPVVPAGVYLAGWSVLTLGWFCALIATFPRWGSEDWAFGRGFNRTPGVWAIKKWCMYKQGSRGKALERAASFFLLMGWMIGFSGTVCMQAQWSGVIPLFNQAYSGFLSQMTSAQVSPLPPLLAARLGSGLAMQFTCWALSGIATAFTWMGSEHYPEFIQPFEHGQQGEAEEYGMSLSQSPFGGLAFGGMGGVPFGGMGGPGGASPASGKGAGLGLV